MRISQRDFLVTGNLNGIALGSTVGLITELLGAPTDTGGTSRRHRRPSIYVYGNIEFFVHQKPPFTCFAIWWYSKRGEFILVEGESAIDVILHPGMSKVDVIDALHHANIEFIEELDQPSPTLVVPNGARLVFNDGLILYAVYSWMR